MPAAEQTGPNLGGYPLVTRRALCAALAGAAGLGSADPLAAQIGDASDALTVGSSHLLVQWGGSLDTRLRADARAWILRSADAVARYFGSFPVPQVELVVTPADGAGIRGGMTSYQAPALRISVRLGRAPRTRSS